MRKVRRLSGRTKAMKNLLPAGIAQPPRVHLPHVPHANEADGLVLFFFHGVDGRRRRESASSHGGGRFMREPREAGEQKEEHSQISKCKKKVGAAICCSAADSRIGGTRLEHATGLRGPCTLGTSV